MEEQEPNNPEKKTLLHMGGRAFLDWRENCPKNGANSQI